MSKNKERENFIDELLEDVENPIVSETGAFGYLGFVESLIMGSNESCTEKDQLINRLDEMRKSEMDALVVKLKDNQIHKDCREQFKQMCRQGVFNY